MTPRDLSRHMWAQHCRLAAWFTPERFAMTWHALAWGALAGTFVAARQGNVPAVVVLSIVANLCMLMSWANFRGWIHP